MEFEIYKKQPRKFMEFAKTATSIKVIEMYFTMDQFDLGIVHFHFKSIAHFLFP